MINLHLTKITKLFDLENLELYGRSSIGTAFGLGDGGCYDNEYCQRKQ